MKTSFGSLLWLVACTGGEVLVETGVPAEDSSPTHIVWTGPEVVLRDCTGTQRSFAELAGRRGLLVAIGAGWCDPCQEDAPLLQAFSEAHADIGVVQVLVQGPGGAPATSADCSDWTESFGLTHPVLIDPVFVTEALVGQDGFPMHLAYDAAGTTTYADAGAFDSAAVLAALP